MPAPIISFRDATKVFPGTRRRPEVRAVDGVSFDIHAGEIFGVIGWSGAGKSTLVRLINALERTTSGSVIVDGVDLAGLTEAKLRPVRRGIGMIFQQFNLLASRTVAGNVCYALEVAGWPRAERAARVAELLEYVGMAEQAGARPHQLSGGQRQRVGIARALATSPRILLADEATSALDPETTRDVLALLRKVNRELGITVVVITHAMSVVRDICDRVAVMEQGKVVELGETYSVFTRPQASLTRRFVSGAMGDRPTGDVLAALRERHPGRLVTVGVGAEGSAPAFRVLAEHRVSGAVVFGGITQVGERPVGALTLELEGAPADVDAAVVGLAQVCDVDDLGGAAHPVTNEEPR